MKKLKWKYSRRYKEHFTELSDNGNYYTIKDNTLTVEVATDTYTIKSVEWSFDKISSAKKVAELMENG